ncbi:hypothetical protein EPO34_01685 [Patescibacteria group bacterium]|nr:MAG: hypothetical protein EPO34_01685 [Patescibacteria group bacterium]
MNNKTFEWVLRIAVAGEFLGHGVFAVQGKAQWIGWIQEILSVNAPTATTLLTLVGWSDIAVAAAVLLWRGVPRAVLLWAAIWGFWTALVRPLVGEPVWDFVERFANWGAPLALLQAYGWPKTVSEWFRIKA